MAPLPIVPPIVSDAVCELPSVTCILYEKNPAVVGVPETVPVLVFRVVPAGNVPLATL